MHGVNFILVSTVCTYVYHLALYITCSVALTEFHANGKWGCNVPVHPAQCVYKFHPADCHINKQTLLTTCNSYLNKMSSHIYVCILQML